MFLKTEETIAGTAPFWLYLAAPIAL